MNSSVIEIPPCYSHFKIQHGLLVALIMDRRTKYVTARQQARQVRCGMQRLQLQDKNASNPTDR